MQVDERLKEWATPVQSAYLDAVKQHGGFRAAARALGVHNATIVKSLKALRRHAQRQGYSPAHDWTKAVPETHIAKGISTYYDQDGKVRGQWVKADINHDKLLENVKACVEALIADVPSLPATPTPSLAANDLCNVYTITDYHVGMLSWGDETGADWDLKTAEDTLTRVFDELLECAPKSSTCVVNQLGDYLHFDSLQAITPTSGNILDADGRYSKVVKVAIRLLRHLVMRALTKHTTVHLVIAEGNHDMASSVWLRQMFTVLFENEPRVIVNQSELPFYAIQHGVNLLGFHHGHTAKHEALPGIFAQQFREMWGSTKHAYIHTGHMHHVSEKEFAGANVVQHPTLAARDAYAARHGWHALRQITSMTYHAKKGHVARNTVYPDLVS